LFEISVVNPKLLGPPALDRIADFLNERLQAVCGDVCTDFLVEIERFFDELSFDEKELADFGYYILSRLYAFKQRGDL